MTNLPRATLILGGARSGKSQFAEKLLEPFDEKVYLATAVAGDNEMKARIDAHRRGDRRKWLS